MDISFQNIIIGQAYDRPKLACMWGYLDWHAIGKGIVKAAGSDKIVLFITGEKQKTLEQYQDDFDGKNLIIDGQLSHRTDCDLINPINETYLFYRKTHHADFVYFGKMKLVSYDLKSGSSPSRFNYVSFPGSGENYK